MAKNGGILQKLHYDVMMTSQDVTILEKKEDPTIICHTEVNINPEYGVNKRTKWLKLGKTAKNGGFWHKFHCDVMMTSSTVNVNTKFKQPEPKYVLMRQHLVRITHYIGPNRPKPLKWRHSGVWRHQRLCTNRRWRHRSKILPDSDSTSNFASETTLRFLILRKKLF